MKSRIVITSLVGHALGLGCDPALHVHFAFGLDRVQVARWDKKNNGFLPIDVRSEHQSFQLKLPIRPVDNIPCCP